MWEHEGKVIDDIVHMPKGTFGFIYEILHVPTGKKYIGKKVLFFKRTKRLGKKELELLKEERKAKKIPGKTPLKKQVISESDWKTYYGSDITIKKMIKEGKSSEFKRTILKFVPTKKLLTYYEAKELFIREVLERDNYFNDNIEARYFRKDFKL